MHQLPTPADASVLDLLLDVVCVVDAAGRFVFVSAASEAVWGYPPQELVGRRMIELVAPDDRARTLEAAGRVMAGGSHLHFENRYTHKDGSMVHMMWSARWSPSDQLRVAVGRNITQRKRAEALQMATYGISEAAHTAADMESLLVDVHRITHSLLPHRGLVVALLGDGGQLSLTRCTGQKVEKSTDHPQQSVQLAFCVEVLDHARAQLEVPTPVPAQAPQPPQTPVPAPPPLDRALRSPMRPLVRGDASVSWMGMPLHTQQGLIGTVMLERQRADAAYTSADTELFQYMATQIASVIERKRLYDRLQHLAMFDALTDLPNRACLEDRMRTAIARVRREDRSLCLLYLDLDHFKQVNDTYGHAVGDALLRDFARRLQACVRGSDTVARMSGDEFVVLLESPIRSDGNEVVTRKIQEEFERPFVLGEHRLHLRPSIGVARYPEDGTNAEQLFRSADDAMYADKHSRRTTAGTPLTPLPDAAVSHG